MRWLDRWFASRWLGNLSVVLIAGGLALLAREWWTRSASPPVVERPIPSLEGEELEPQVRSHIAEINQASQRVLQRRDLSPPQRGQAYGELGRIFVTYRLWGHALPALGNATQLDRESFQWPYLLAHTYSNLPDLPSAEGAMTEALRRMPRDAAAKPADQVAADCFLAEMAKKQGHPAEVGPHLEQALRLDPKCVYALFTRGVLASEAEQYDAAIGDLEAAARLRPLSQAIRGALAAVHRRAGHLEQAKQWTVTITTQDRQPVVPPDPLLAGVMSQSRSSLRDNRAATRLMEQGRYKSAQRALAAGLTHAPDSHTLLRNHAICLNMLERYPEARDTLDHMRGVKDPNDEDQALWLHVRFELPEERDEALAEAEAWARDHPENPLARQTLAQGLLAVERLADALRVLEQWRDLEPDDPQARLNLLECLGRLGDGERLEAELRSLVEDFPGNTRIEVCQAHFLACGPREESRNPQQALEIVKRQLQVRPSAVLLEIQAAALHTLGETAGARAAINKALEIAGNEAVPPVLRRMQALERAIESGTPYVEPWPLADPARVHTSGK